MSSNNPGPATVRKSPWGGPLAVVCVVAVLAVGVLGYVYYTNRPEPETEGITGLREAVAQQEKFRVLADGYGDADGDLIADRPSVGLLNPDVLVFAEIPTADVEKDEARWKPFVEHLAKTTGKKVIHWRPADADVTKDGPSASPGRASSGAQAQMAALRTGQLHVTAFNTGAVTAAVNTAGFVPVVCPADPEGKFGYEMEVIVPADGPVQKPEDLRGETVALVSMSSNSGGRAGMVYLKSLGLVPGRDYKFLFTGTHLASIKEVAEKRVDAAFVANDLLRAEIAKGTIKPEQYRSVHKSATFPPLCFGMAYNLEPGLAAKVREAFVTFDKLPDVYGNTPNRAKFAPMEYKRDWGYVREVDEKLKTVLD